MKIELKKIKHSDFASQETYCYQAVVYVDGKAMFNVSNDGWGGCDMQEPIKSEWTDRHHAVIAYIKALPKTVTSIKNEDGSFWEMEQNLEGICCDLMNDHLNTKQAKKILKRVSYIDNGDLYQMAAKIKPTTETLEDIKKLGWWKKSYILLNELSMDDAIKAIRKAA